MMICNTYENVTDALHMRTVVSYIIASKIDIAGLCGLILNRNYICKHYFFECQLYTITKKRLFNYIENFTTKK